MPTISVVIGEGGSGGALALGVTDRILMFENAVYSVISPEGAPRSSGRRTRRGTRPLPRKVTAADLASLGVIDEVLPEPTGGAQNDPRPRPTRSPRR